MAAGLGQHALAGIDQDHRQVGGRGSGDHVAGILFVPRRIGDDEGPPGCRKESVGNVNGDALFPLGSEAIDQQRKIERCPLRSVPGGIGGQCRHLVGQHRLAVIKQPPN